MPEEDENTCAVQLVYRHQEPQHDDGVFIPPKQPDGPVKSPLSPIVETSRYFTYRFKISASFCTGRYQFLKKRCSYFNLGRITGLGFEVDPRLVQKK